MASGSIEDLKRGTWELEKDRTGEDSSTILVDGVPAVSVRLMGRPHADEVALARHIVTAARTAQREELAPAPESA